MSALGICDSLPRVMTTVDMWSMMVICEDEACVKIPVVQRWLLYDDGSYVITSHHARDPMRGTSEGEFDPERTSALYARVESWRALAAPSMACAETGD